MKNLLFFNLCFIFITCISTLNAQLRVTSAGDIGIGYNNPSSKLEIRDYSPAELRLVSTNTNGISRIWHMNYNY